MLDCAEPVFRLPYHPYDAELRAKGKAPIEAIGVEHTPGSELLNLKDEDFLTSRSGEGTEMKSWGLASGVCEGCVL